MHYLLPASMSLRWRRCRSADPVYPRQGTTCTRGHNLRMVGVKARMEAVDLRAHSQLAMRGETDKETNLV